MTIPYDQKTDIALIDVQVMIAAYGALAEEYHEQFKDSSNQEKEQDCKLITAMQVQDRVNQSILLLLEKIMAPTYPRAEHP